MQLSSAVLTEETSDGTKPKPLWTPLWPARGTLTCHLRKHQVYKKTNPAVPTSSNSVWHAWKQSVKRLSVIHTILWDAYRTGMLFTFMKQPGDLPLPTTNGSSLHKSSILAASNTETHSLLIFLHGIYCPSNLSYLTASANTVPFHRHWIFSLTQEVITAPLGDALAGARCSGQCIQCSSSE